MQPPPICQERMGYSENYGIRIFSGEHYKVVTQKKYAEKPKTKQTFREQLGQETSTPVQYF